MTSTTLTSQTRIDTTSALNLAVTTFLPYHRLDEGFHAEYYNEGVPILADARFSPDDNYYLVTEFQGVVVRDDLIQIDTNRIVRPKQTHATSDRVDELNNILIGTLHKNYDRIAQTIGTTNLNKGEARLGLPDYGTVHTREVLSRDQPDRLWWFTSADTQLTPSLAMRQFYTLVFLNDGWYLLDIQAGERYYFSTDPTITIRENFHIDEQGELATIDYMVAHRTNQYDKTALANARHWFTRRDLLAKNTLDNERIN